MSSFCAPDKNDTPVLPPYQLIWVRIVTVALLSYVIWGTVFNFSEAELPYIKIGIIMTQNEVIRRVKTYTYWIFLATSNEPRLVGLTVGGGTFLE